MSSTKQNPERNPKPVLTLAHQGVTAYEIFMLLTKQIMDYPARRNAYFFGPSLVVKDITPNMTRTNELELNDPQTWLWLQRLAQMGFDRLNNADDLVIAIEAMRDQLRLVAAFMRDAGGEVSTAWADIMHACEFQAGVGDRALAKVQVPPDGEEQSQSSPDARHCANGCKENPLDGLIECPKCGLLYCDECYQVKDHLKNCKPVAFGSGRGGGRKVDHA